MQMPSVSFSGLDYFDLLARLMQEFVQFPYRCVGIAMRFIGQSLSHFLDD